MRLIPILLLGLCGCLYHVPFTERLSGAKHAEGVAYEKEARRNGWKMWKLYLHSWDTCPFHATGRAASLTIPPLQLLSWPSQWLGLDKSHEVYLRKYFKESVDEEFHGDGDDSLPPNDELWMNRAFVPVFGE